MSTSKKSAPARKGGGAKTLKFRGVELKVPAKIPGTFGYDFGEVQRLGMEGDPAVVGAVQQLLVSVFGEDELKKVRPKVKGINDPWQIELLTALVGVDGLDWGEA